MCGENPQAEVWHEQPWGSSPRVRGKPEPGHIHLDVRGLIPACAGKTFLGINRRAQLSAHPRVCGENVAYSAALVVSQGSSPRVRGKHPCKLLRLRDFRLIPACAGKTPSPAQWDETTTAHPRVCGENPPLGTRRPTTRGSSPRVRGKHEASMPHVQLRGLIPACAGKTDDTGGETRVIGAHPRVCGENRLCR
mgnify:CR=1 FL=1